MVVKMGMIACYMEAERDLIENLRNKSDEDLFDEIEALAEENMKMYDMDKLWDGLHFILTGVSATMPVENNLLSEAIVGTAMFSDDEEADFIAYIYPERVSEILSALNEFDINKALNDFSPRKLAQNGIYPTIWVESEKDELKGELTEAFNGLKEFFRNMCIERNGVIVSIY